MSTTTLKLSFDYVYELVEARKNGYPHSEEAKKDLVALCTSVLRKLETALSPPETINKTYRHIKIPFEMAPRQDSFNNNNTISNKPNDLQFQKNIEFVSSLRSLIPESSTANIHYPAKHPLAQVYNTRAYLEAFTYSKTAFDTVQPISNQHFSQPPEANQETILYNHIHKLMNEKVLPVDWSSLIILRLKAFYSKNEENNNHLVSPLLLCSYIIPTDTVKKVVNNSIDTWIISENMTKDSSPLLKLGEMLAEILVSAKEPRVYLQILLGQFIYALFHIYSYHPGCATLGDYISALFEKLFDDSFNLKNMQSEADRAISMTPQDFNRHLQSIWSIPCYNQLLERLDETSNKFLNELKSQTNPSNKNNQPNREELFISIVQSINQLSLSYIFQGTSENNGRYMEVVEIPCRNTLNHIQKEPLESMQDVLGELLSLMQKMKPTIHEPRLINLKETKHLTWHIVTFVYTYDAFTTFLSEFGTKKYRDIPHLDIEQSNEEKEALKVALEEPDQRLYLEYTIPLLALHPLPMETLKRYAPQLFRSIYAYNLMFKLWGQGIPLKSGNFIAVAQLFAKHKANNHLTSHICDYLLPSVTHFFTPSGKRSVYLTTSVCSKKPSYEILKNLFNTVLNPSQKHWRTFLTDFLYIQSHVDLLDKNHLTFSHFFFKLFTQFLDKKFKSENSKDLIFRRSLESTPSDFLKYFTSLPLTQSSDSQSKKKQKVDTKT